MLNVLWFLFEFSIGSHITNLKISIQKYVSNQCFTEKSKSKVRNDLKINNIPEQSTFRNIMVLIESVVSGHTYTAIRERLGDKLELIKFDPYSKYLSTGR